MKLQLDKPWLPLTPEAVRSLPGQLGVYQLADEAGQVVYIGYAGGRSLFGLRGEVEKHLGDGRVRSFRAEVNQQYQTRWRELLMLHRAQHDVTPELNIPESLPTLGRLG
jgi:hypothetical protein